VKPKGYLFFHLNRVFSSIEEKLWAVMPLLPNESFNNKTLSGVLFSIKEVDDTVKNVNSISPFTLPISSAQQ
jgi:hypothetical protein